MKELSIEEKAKAYDNVREKIAIRFGCNVAKEIFSEYEESEELEEAAKKYGTKKHPVTKIGANESAYDFKAGAEWQKQQDQETIELAEDHAMFAGMEKMKQQMLSKAVDASCNMECNGNGTICTKKIPLNGLRCGDTCKVIILKDE